MKILSINIRIPSSYQLLVELLLICAILWWAPAILGLPRTALHFFFGMEHTYSQASRAEEIFQVLPNVLIFFLEVVDKPRLPVVAYFHIQRQLFLKSVYFFLAFWTIVHAADYRVSKRVFVVLLTGGILLRISARLIW